MKRGNVDVDDEENGTWHDGVGRGEWAVAAHSTSLFGKRDEWAT